MLQRHTYTSDGAVWSPSKPVSSVSIEARTVWRKVISRPFAYKSDISVWRNAVYNPDTVSALPVVGLWFALTGHKCIFGLVRKESPTYVTDDLAVSVEQSCLVCLEWFNEQSFDVRYEPISMHIRAKAKL